MGDLAPSGGRPSTTPAIDASTIVLLREAAGPPELFLMERHLDSDFVGGAYVFPGGKVDDVDRDLDPALWSGIHPPHVEELVGADSPRDALGLHVAAVRETFEEAGVLLARRGDRPVTAADLASDSFVEARRALAARGEPYDWTPWLRDEGLVLDLSALALWSWWVTPDGDHKRFDTRFFAAAVPPEQREASAHDGVEMTDSVWITVGDALAAGERGERRIVYPTRKNLEALAEYVSAEALLSACRMGLVDQRRIKPTARKDDEGRVWIKHPFEDELELF